MLCGFLLDVEVPQRATVQKIVFPQLLARRDVLFALWLQKEMATDLYIQHIRKMLCIYINAII